MKKVVLFLVFIIIGVGVFFGYKFYEDKKEEEALKQKEAKIKEITGHYSSIVKTNKDAVIYDDEKKESGKIAKDTILNLDEIKIDENTEYFYIEDLKYFIKYEDVEKTEEVKKVNQRYKNFVVFNQNVVTKDVTNFYQDDKLVYTFNKSFDLPIIIKDTDRYYVEFNDELYYVLKEGTEVKESQNTNEATRGNVKTLLYHFIHPDNMGCDSSICLRASKFEEQLKYIKDEGYFALSMEEVELFLDGKVRIPKKSIVLTIDDGAKAEYAIPLLEKYEVKATLFLITSWYDPNTFKSDYLDVESHTHNMHNTGVCNMGLQGGAILCWSEEKVLEDLKTSVEKIGGSKYFAYPFFDYSTRAISLLQKAGFKMAFIGAGGQNGYSYPGINKYKVPRTTVFSDITMSTFKQYLS